MKIHKYTNILKMISLNFDPYNSCNHFSKLWGCMILCMCMQSLVPFIANTPHYTRKPFTSKTSNKRITSRLWISYIDCWTWNVRWNVTLLTWNLPWAPMKHPLNWSDWVRKQLYPFLYAFDGDSSGSKQTRTPWVQLRWPVVACILWDRHVVKT